MAKGKIIIVVIMFAFTIYFGIQLFGPDGSISQYQAAVEEREIAEKELAEANQELDNAIKNLREVTS